jgi:hypothetical protein
MYSKRVPMLEKPSLVAGLEDLSKYHFVGVPQIRFEHAHSV